LPVVSPWFTASQKVHLRRCASSFVIAAYFYVRLIPQDSRALHQELFTVPSTLATFHEIIHGRGSLQEMTEEIVRDFETLVKDLTY
jgi:hypothetical protein